MVAVVFPAVVGEVVVAAAPVVVAAAPAAVVVVAVVVAAAPAVVGEVVVAAALAAVVVAAAGGSGGGGGGGGQTYTPPPGSTLYPDRDIVNGFNVIFIEDHVEEVDGYYRINVRLASVFRSLVAYGGSGVTGNITYGTAYIVTNYYKIPIVGFASTNATIRQDFPGMMVRLTQDGGYVVYTPVSMAIYYRRYTFNIGNTVVYVWVPAKSLPSTLVTEVTQHVYIDPEAAFYYVNGQPYRLVIDEPPRRAPKGVLRSWVLYANRYGTYVFQINP